MLSSSAKTINCVVIVDILIELLKLNTETAVCLLRTEPSCISLSMMMASATWRSITALTYVGNGHQLDENATSAALNKNLRKLQKEKAK